MELIYFIETTELFDNTTILLKNFSWCLILFIVCLFLVFAPFYFIYLFFFLSTSPESQLASSMTTHTSWNLQEVISTEGLGQLSLNRKNRKTSLMLIFHQFLKHGENRGQVAPVLQNKDWRSILCNNEQRLLKYIQGRAN